MKKKTFILLFIGVHVLFIALQIDKQSRMVRLSYKKQKDEQKYKELITTKQALVNKLYAIKNKKEIKAYAQEQLDMKPLKLHSIKRISTYGQNA